MLLDLHDRKVPCRWDGFKSDNQIPVKISGQGVELTVLKKAEKEESWVFRIVETHGRISNASLFFSGKVVECNLMEWENSSNETVIENEMKLELKPFEIKTYKLKL